MTAPAHLDDFALAALALGDLLPSLAADAREHLHRCPGCAAHFAAVAAEADVVAAPGDEALQFEGAPAAAPLRLAEAARPDGGVVLLFPSRPEGERRAGSGMGGLASQVFSRFGSLLHAAAGIPETGPGYQVLAGPEVHALQAEPGRPLRVWFGNPHRDPAWLTVLRQPAAASQPPSVCDGPRELPAGRKAAVPTELSVGAGEEVLLAVLTRQRPPSRARLDEALRLGLFEVFDALEPLGQLVCRVGVA